MPYLCFDAKCYMLHGLRAQLSTQKKSLIIRASFMASTDVNPPVYRGRFTTKGVGRLPRRDVSVSPQSPITHCSNTSRHQGAFALFIFGSLFLSLSLSLSHFSPLATVNGEKVSCTRVHEMQQTTASLAY